MMNKDIFEGKWKEMRGQIKEWWGKLTDDDLEQAAGNAEQIIGLLQQKYGYTRERAEEEFNRRIKEVKEAVDED
ncbi:MAG TPA: CsbD family protein [Anaerolineales bacterium]|nr:CsbD family protein [Anaerolineales bacterium]